MRKYEMLPIDKLVSDVAVDPLHARELADSIMSRGQLAPVIVREETKEVIDGFHRIAAMKELGFTHVECVLTPCDDEGFWDFRIIQASLHKNVTFARAIDWIEKVFEVTPLRKHWEHGGEREYKSAYSVFASYNHANPPNEVKEWVETKSAMWGLAPKTIENWLYTKQNLAPELLKEATFPLEGEVGLSSYHIVAGVLPGKPELQKRVMEKAKAEDLSGKDVRTLAQALKRAEDTDEVQSILRQPISRTEEQIVREAKIEHLIAHPPVPEAREVIQRVEMEADVIELKLVWEQLATMAEEADLATLDRLTNEQKEGLIRSGEQCIQASQKVIDYLKRKLGKMIELPGKEV